MPWLVCLLISVCFNFNLLYISILLVLLLVPMNNFTSIYLQAVWLPGSQTELAIITADFVKIYNLSADAISPQYYFLLPSGKISDATFVFSEDNRQLLLMSSTGYIYTQPMDEASSATHGPFYITNILDVKHAEIKVGYSIIYIHLYTTHG